MITLLRDNPKVDQSLELADGASGAEVGRLDLSLRLDAVGIQAIVNEDVRHIEKAYFDPFEQNDEVVTSKLRQVEALLDSKQVELEETKLKTETLRTAEKSIEIELAKLREERDKVKVFFSDPDGE